MCHRFGEKLGGEIETIDAGHDVMLSQPAALAALIVRTASVVDECEQPGSSRAGTVRDPSL